MVYLLVIDFVTWKFFNNKNAKLVQWDSGSIMKTKFILIFKEKREGFMFSYKFYLDLRRIVVEGALQFRS